MVLTRRREVIVRVEDTLEINERDLKNLTKLLLEDLAANNYAADFGGPLTMKEVEGAINYKAASERMTYTVNDYYEILEIFCNIVEDYVFDNSKSKTVSETTCWSENWRIERKEKRNES